MGKLLFLISDINFAQRSIELAFLQKLLFEMFFSCFSVTFVFICFWCCFFFFHSLKEVDYEKK